MKSGITWAVAFVGLCEPVFADQPGPYVYGTVGTALAHINKGYVDSQVSASQGGATIDSSVKGNPTTFKLNAGYQLRYNIGFELGYTSTGSFAYSTSAPSSAQASEKLQIWDLALAAGYVLGSGFIVVFRGGVANVHVSSSGSIANFGGSATNGYGGLGFKYALGENLSVRADWDVFAAPAGAKLGQVNLLSAGVGYNF
jgi:hypothetical protein